MTAELRVSNGATVLVDDDVFEWASKQRWSMAAGNYAALSALRKSTVLNSENERSPCCMLEEVRNGTGFKRTERYADALVVSLWPSRGIWFAGVEVKVSRSDWMSELKNPAKAAEILKWCDFWWLATGPGVALAEEIPEQWGWIEVVATDKKTTCKIRKQAPRLTPDSPDKGFVAAVLRKIIDGETSRQAAAANKARELLIRNGAAVDATELARLQAVDREHGKFQKAVEEYCAASGEDLHQVKYNAKETGNIRALASRLIAGAQSIRWDAPRRLRELADEIERAEGELKRLHADAESLAGLTNKEVA